jgi:molybdopterin-guanine dinucleotide biosynthesis protein A
MLAGIVLAGGRSSRMGRPKAALEWHGSTLLRRVSGLVGRAVDGPVVVVRAAGQELPPLAAGVEVVEDALADRGPLQGLAAGLAALDGRAHAAFVAATDLPFLHPEFVRAVAAALEADADAAVPHAGGRPQPLAAAYRLTVRPVVERRLAADHRDRMSLLGELRVRRLDALPHPESLRNLNDPGAYAAARAAPPPLVYVNGAPVRAATLGQVAAGPAEIDGVAVAGDPELPLADGDRISLSAGYGPR